MSKSKPLLVRKPFVKQPSEDPIFAGSFGYLFICDRDPESIDDAYINEIGFGTEEIVIWWNQVTNNILQLTNWSNTPLIWMTCITSLSLLPQLNAAGWQVNSSRKYFSSGISFNTPRQPSLTNDIYVISSINFVNVLATTTTVTFELSVDNSNWITVGQIANTTGVASNTTQMNSFLVPQGYYYRLVSSGSGTINLVSCQELSF